MASRGASRVAYKFATVAPSMRQRASRLAQPSSLAHSLSCNQVRSSLSLRPWVRLAHSIPRPPTSPTNSSAATDNTTTGEAVGQGERALSSNSAKKYPHSSGSIRELQPHYELTFTCIPCGERSSHSVSKQGYHHGSVLISCPGCRNRHVISDHLRIFGDKNLTVEDILRERGDLVKKGTLGEDGDLEFWEDGSVTPRQKPVQGTAEPTEQTASVPGDSFTSVRPKKD